MKVKGILLIMALLLCGVSAEAQFWKKIKERVKEGVEEAILRKTEEKTTEKTENAIDSIFEAPKKLKRKKKKGKNGKRNSNNNQNNNPQNNEESIEEWDEENTSSQNLKPWSNYNFVPGDKIIFQDDLLNEENGEFPSRWDLIKGSTENAVFDEENIINLKNNTIITPLLDKESYLPEVFTIEFDAYFYSEKGFGSHWQSYGIRFSPKGEKVYYPEGSEDYFYPITLKRDGANMSSNINGIKKEFEGSEKELDVQPVWRHFAIAFNKRSLKIFVDQHRVLSIPNLGKGFKPQQFSIHAYSYYDDGYIRAIKNIRIGEGGKKLYDRIVAEGRFVTRGILFDINKATLKPESMGVINRVAKMMEQHPDLNFNIEGHTDSDGNDESNLELSAQRAIAVKEALIEFGIDESRLQTEGKGESVPVSDNTTPEGKANNRRVEFVKL